MSAFHNEFVHLISDYFPYLRKNDLYFKTYITIYNFEDGIVTKLRVRVPKETKRSSHNINCNMSIFKIENTTN